MENDHVREEEHEDQDDRGREGEKSPAAEGEEAQRHRCCGAGPANAKAPMNAKELASSRRGSEIERRVVAREALKTGLFFVGWPGESLPMPGADGGNSGEVARTRGAKIDLPLKVGFVIGRRSFAPRRPLTDLRRVCAGLLERVGVV